MFMIMIMIMIVIVIVIVIMIMIMSMSDLRHMSEAVERWPGQIVRTLAM